MTADSVGETSPDPELLEAARGGDGDAFRWLVESHRREIHAHCYRMLGSVHDAEDALQDMLLRAWRGMPRFEGRSSLRSWLYRIATNVCLDRISQRAKRALPVSYGPAADPDVDPGEPLIESTWVEPYPDERQGMGDGYASPEARYERRESVELGFIVALQLLPATQRAVLILRDVLDWSAKETAEALGDSVAAVNSALQRARAGLARARTLGAPQHLPARDADEHALLSRFMEAWDAVDVDRIVSLLARDAMMAMPPDPFYARGAEAIGAFFGAVPLEGHLEQIRLVPTAANRQPALAAYAWDPEAGEHRAYGVMVFALQTGGIAGIVGFADAALFERFGLPTGLEG